jgi:hypothetical protein
MLHIPKGDRPLTVSAVEVVKSVRLHGLRIWLGQRYKARVCETLMEKVHLEERVRNDSIQYSEDVG